MTPCWKDKAIKRISRYAKLHKRMRLLMIVGIIGVLSVHYIYMYFVENQKKLVGVVLTMLVFVVSSSFSAPSFSTKTTDLALSDQMLESVVEEKETVYSEELTETDKESTTDLQCNENVDKYTVDEILDGKETIYNFREEPTPKVSNVDTFSKEDWNLVLINKQHPIPDDYTFTLGTIKGAMQCDERIIDGLLDMLQGAKADGVNLAVCSPYRDYTRQEYLFDKKVKAYMGKGETYIEAYKTASQTVTVPGASEHQIGLAVDLISDCYGQLDEGFGKSAGGLWLQQHCNEYGFVLRYPDGKQSITGIDYEPWHFRYVGTEAATIIMKEGITLEEFVERLN